MVAAAKQFLSHVKRLNCNSKSLLPMIFPFADLPVRNLLNAARSALMKELRQQASSSSKKIPSWNCSSNGTRFLFGSYWIQRHLSTSFMGREAPSVKYGEPDTSNQMKSLETKNLPTALIVGRPNVGKSKLFNRLTHRHEAIVYNTPEGHVTRDHREGVAKIGDIRFRLIDTAGLEPGAESGSVLCRTTGITRNMLADCQLLLFMIDGRDGILPPDEEVASWLRKVDHTLPVILLVNKCEGLHREGSGALISTVAESHRFGFGEPVPISAETGEGMSDLYNRLQPIVDKAVNHTSQSESSPQQEGEDDKNIPLQLAICGRPNVGKSTILNNLLGKERSLTGPEPGLTRDSVRDVVEFNGKSFWLVDTAGWIQRAELAGTNPDAMSAQDARNRMRRSQVVALVLDAVDIVNAQQTLKRSEMALARWVVLEGKAMIVVVNKMDSFDPSRQQILREKIKSAVPIEIYSALPQIGKVPILFSSALREDMKAVLLPVVEDSYARWCTRLPTSRLNIWLGKVQARKSETKGHGSKVRYLTQVKARPPTFVAFTSGSKPLRDSDLSFLSTALREDFGMDGVPVRVIQKHTPRRKQRRGTQQR